MTINDARKSIYSRFVTEWADETAYVFENDALDETEGSGEFVRVYVRNQATNQDSMGPVGSREWLRVGSLFVKIYVPASAGMSRADALAQMVRNSWEGVTTTDDIHFTECEVRELVDEPNYKGVICQAHFSYHERR